MLNPTDKPKKEKFSKEMAALNYGLALLWIACKNGTLRCFKGSKRNFFLDYRYLK